MQMKNYIKLLYGIVLVSLLAGCTEDEFSKNYDINLPVSEIVDFNPKTERVGYAIRHLRVYRKCVCDHRQPG